MTRAVIIIVTVMLGTINTSYAEVSLIMNGSFEKDGYIGNVAAEEPSYWCDVSIPAVKFDGWVGGEWWTHSYDDGSGKSLTLYSGGGTFSAGEMAKVSQQVFLESNVKSIIFDLKLVPSPPPWDPNKRSAVVLVDGDIIWDSNELQLDDSGKYEGQVEIDANQFQQYLQSDEWHTLTLALKANLDETEYFYDCYVRWDFVRFDKYCGGLGYLVSDLNQDCYVDNADFAALASAWLEPIPAEKYDLFEDGSVNLYDLMYFAEDWLLNTDSNNWGQGGCFEMELLKNDIDNSGQIDLGDIFVLSEDWLSEDDCSRADVIGDGIVNLRDFATIIEQWQQKSWIYYLD